jgi:hypothetical protein
MISCNILYNLILNLNDSNQLCYWSILSQMIFKSASIYSSLLIIW